MNVLIWKKLELNNVLIWSARFQFCHESLASFLLTAISLLNYYIQYHFIFFLNCESKKIIHIHIYVSIRVNQFFCADSTG